MPEPGAPVSPGPAAGSGTPAVLWVPFAGLNCKPMSLSSAQNRRCFSL